MKFRQVRHIFYVRNLMELAMISMNQLSKHHKKENEMKKEPVV